MKAVLLLLAVCTYPLVAGSFMLLSDTLDLRVGTYRSVKFRITPEMADSTCISGEFSTKPVPAKVEFILMTELDYRRGWQGRGTIDTLGIVYAEKGQLFMDVPDFGDYILIISNRGNTSSVVLEADLAVTYRGTGVLYDSLPFGMTLLMSILAVGVVLAAVLLTMKKLSSGKT
jgi:hypothetical protein